MPPLASPPVPDLAPAGVLRAAINFGNPVLAQPAPDGGEPRGVSADLAREIARLCGIEVLFIAVESAAMAVEAAAEGQVDLLFLAIDPARAQDVLYTAPYLVIEGTYLVRRDAPFACVDDLDRQGLRIAVGKGAAYDLYLSRTLHHATLERAGTSAGAIDLFVTDGLDAAAGVRQPLSAWANTHTGYRVMPGAFTVIQQAVATPRGRETACAWLRAFVEEAKASGFIAEALARSGQKGAALAPLSESSLGDQSG